MSQAACPSQHATPVATVPRVHVAPLSVEYARKMLAELVFEKATRLFVLVGLTSTKLSAWLPGVALTFTTGSRQPNGAKQIGEYRRTFFGLYAFAWKFGHIDALGRRQHLRVHDGCGSREKCENGGKCCETEACVHIDAASKLFCFSFMFKISSK